MITGDGAEQTPYVCCDGGTQDNPCGCCGAREPAEWQDEAEMTSTWENKPRGRKMNEINLRAKRTSNKIKHCSLCDEGHPRHRGYFAYQHAVRLKDGGIMHIECENPQDEQNARGER